MLHYGVKRGQKYPEEVRHFCISLLSCNPRAYELVRRTFHNHLPTLGTIKSWFANSDLRSDPGFQESTLERLTKIARDFEEKHKYKLMCSLIYDEVHIKQQVYWSPQEMKYIGFKSDGDSGDSPDESLEKTIVKQAIVFMLNGIDVNFEYPIAYHYINELNASQRKDLLSELIVRLTNCGIKITNVTFDGEYNNNIYKYKNECVIDIFRFDPIRSKPIPMRVAHLPCFMTFYSPQ